MSDKKLKTRCYYTEYVNHMVRFYITCPDGISTSAKRRADIENWVAVQGVLHFLPDNERQLVMDVYKTHYNLPKAVDMYCTERQLNQDDVWIVLTKVAAKIAKARGLV